MGRILFGFLLVMGPHVAVRVGVVAVVLAAAAFALTQVGAWPWSPDAWEAPAAGPLAHIALDLALGLGTLAAAVALIAPFRMPKDREVGWLVYRESGEGEAERTSAEDAENEDIPRPLLWLVGARIHHVGARKLVWGPTQVVIGALGAAAAAFLMAGIIAAQANAEVLQVLDEPLVLASVLLGGAAGVLGGGIGRTFAESAVMALVVFGTCIERACFVSRTVTPWVHPVIPTFLWWTTVGVLAMALLTKPIARLGRWTHLVGVGVLFPVLLAGMVVRSVREGIQEIIETADVARVDPFWAWSSPDGRLLLAGNRQGHAAVHPRHLPSPFGFVSIYAIDPATGAMRCLTAETPLDPLDAWYMPSMRSGRVIEALVFRRAPTEVELLLSADPPIPLQRVFPDGRVEMALDSPESREITSAAAGMDALVAGMPWTIEDTTLVDEAARDGPDPWPLVELRPAERVVVLAWLVDDVLAVCDLPAHRTTWMRDAASLVLGPHIPLRRGDRLLVACTETTYEGGTRGRVVLLDLATGERTPLGDVAPDLGIEGDGDGYVLVATGPEHARSFGWVSLAAPGPIHAIAYPGETVADARVAPTGEIYAWTDRAIHVLRPGANDRLVGAPPALGPPWATLVGYLGPNPILHAGDDLVLIDLATGEPRTLVADRFSQGY